MKRPLSFTALVTLSRLQREPLHGYLLWKKLAPHLSRSSLYRTLAQLVKAGLIATVEFSAPDAPSHRTYQITPTGKAVLQKRGEELRKFAETELDQSLINYQQARALLLLLEQEVLPGSRFQNGAEYS